ncbi:unnamed protein product [Polarella glacialis]|uniref:EF-hand domain-containing protein n=1 Tax=Polarella glacialis TaxID=89957 RepID=A0A813H6K0_POLGL|nr:unnamed protein product [Polarella glacialis]
MCSICWGDESSSDTIELPENIQIQLLCMGVVDADMLSQLRSSFQALDADKSGSLSREELKQSQNQIARIRRSEVARERVFRNSAAMGMRLPTDFWHEDFVPPALVVATASLDTLKDEPLPAQSDCHLTIVPPLPGSVL